MYTTFIGCSSLGQLVQLDSSDRGYNRTGVFVLPQPVQSCGRLTFIKTMGFFDASQGGDVYRFRVLIYRKNCSDMYEEIYRMTIDSTCSKEQLITTPYNEILCSFQMNDIDYVVNEGDLIAAQTTNNCNTNQCGFRPVILSRTNQTTRVLFTETLDFGCLSALDARTDIFLNIEASIGNCWTSKTCYVK